jgi:hypothetical protein
VAKQKKKKLKDFVFENLVIVLRETVKTLTGITCKLQQ